MGARAKARAKAVFDWSAIIPQYQALWAELNARRAAAPVQAPVTDDPFRPDPFRLFASYPTRHLASDWRVSLTPGLDWPAAKAVLASPLAAYSLVNRPDLSECEQIVAWLQDRPDARVAEVAAIFPPVRRSAISRGLLWIARFGVLDLRPPA
jgi:hypothetical protein